MKVYIVAEQGQDYYSPIAVCSSYDNAVKAIELLKKKGFSRKYYSLEIEGFQLDDLSAYGINL